MLDRIGFDVITAANGSRAIDIFREKAGEIDCVILDLTMPDLDGEQTFAAIQSINENIPVILSSGYSEQEIVDRFTGKGFAGFLHKPYEIATLRGKLMEIIKPAD
jgi:CheY-like chemotaxis protein